MTKMRTDVDVRVLGGLSLLEGTLTKSAVAVNIGNTPIGIPNVQANIGDEWDLPWMRRLTLNDAVIYTGRQFIDTETGNRSPIATHDGYRPTETGG
jgi:iron complex outermembrane receptor protein